MQLGRTQVSTLRPPPILSITFSEDGRFFSVAGETGYEIHRTCPLGLVKRRVLPGTLERVILLPGSPGVVLQGGGANPLYPPNKAVIYHDGLGVAVAELEFGERIRGIAVRRSTICIALLRKILAFEYTTSPSSSAAEKRAESSGRGEFSLRKVGEWHTVENEQGLVALATSPGSTLLAIPGRQPGHVQLVNLPPCPGPSTAGTPATPSRTGSTSFRSPIVLAHTHPLSTLSCSPDGTYLLTTSERGTLLRVWDTARGRLERELRRGVDRAEMWGAAFANGSGGLSQGTSPMSPLPKGEGSSRLGGRVMGWSDKGTIHVWASGDEPSSAKSSSSSSSGAAPSLTKLISRNLPLPKYFSSPPSFAQYRLPRKNPHAFASAIGAAAAASGVPSMRFSEGAGENEDLAERFIVGWVEVDVDIEERQDENPSPNAASAITAAAPQASRRQSVDLRGVVYENAHRRSFGSSENTSRTATPSIGRSQTPVQTRPLVSRTSSKMSSRATPSDKPRTTRKEQQLVAVTYAGDWYRLRIPDLPRHGQSDIHGGGGEDPSEADVASRSRKCELVEYRRFTVGGDGW